MSLIVLSNVSCKKSEDDNSRQRRFVSFKLDSKIYLAENPKGTIYVPNFSDDNPLNDFPKMEITAQSYTGDVITFTLATAALPFKPGTYPCTKKGNSMLIALNNSMRIALSSKASTDFYITITRIDNITVEGTFAGTLVDTTISSITKKATDGAFRAVITQVSQ
ncbi:hypothetical protein [Chitinophaga nivalis]|uniref:Uncharacterized protein n=1 Tax=Chitinophaga nivalis TaxID=2991709 RepID=A0ABT3ITV2_9BACT|nr:hypothetical protein [Chitinophaga nivalis]MCW3462893.1 hypothetical protein [Chitinophaga nivalis]MCW3487417.1 hypothetical protein [Chitinophaga nivalis]